LVRVYARSAADAKLDPSKVAELEDQLATRRKDSSPCPAAIVRSVQMFDPISPAGQPAGPANAKSVPPFPTPFDWGGFVYTGYRLTFVVWLPP
jgi:hypothetical protein